MAVTEKRDYKLVSADGHFNEPGDLWTSRVPSKFKDAVPRIERFEDGDAWVIEGYPDPRPFGWGACAGVPLPAWIVCDRGGVIQFLWRATEGGLFDHYAESSEILDVLRVLQSG